MKMPFLLISPKIVPKIQLIKKGGCFEYHAVIADKIKYRYVHRASICPALGMDKRNEFNIEQFLSRRLKLKAGDEFVVVDAD